MKTIDSDIPLIGFSAFSGTGKTTLLIRLIPYLRRRGIRMAVLKHAHHNFDIDHPSKDSYELRHAGAAQMLISSSRRWALMVELDDGEEEKKLQELIPQLDPKRADLILVEGFKKAGIEKIELHRPSLGHPLLCENDNHIIAVASDDQVKLPRPLPLLDLNNPGEIGDFICSHCKLEGART